MKEKNYARNNVSRGLTVSYNERNNVSGRGNVNYPAGNIVSFTITVNCYARNIVSLMITVDYLPGNNVSGISNLSPYSAFKLSTGFSLATFQARSSTQEMMMR